MTILSKTGIGVFLFGQSSFHLSIGPLVRHVGIADIIFYLSFVVVFSPKV